MRSYFAMGRSSYDESGGKNEYIYINNFGFHRDICDDIEVSRPRGRLDYHLLYVSSGEIYIDGKVISNGDFYIFYPGEPQRYIYKSAKDSFYYWIHFTGCGALELLSDMRGGAHSANGRRQEADELLKLLTQALGRRGEEHSAYPVALLISFFKLLFAPKTDGYPFSRAVKILEQLRAPIRLGELSGLYRMSEEHFIRSFKKTYGLSPIKYRITCQLQEAKNLLTDTTLSISGIAVECGFSDPLYFSRLFKKHTGISPSEYRRREFYEQGAL